MSPGFLIGATQKEGDMSELLWDIETTGLHAKTGDIVISVAFLDITELYKENEPVVLGNLDVPNDVAITVDIVNELAGWGRIIGWNTHGFDLKFLNERLLQAGERPLLHKGSFDLKEHYKKLYPYLDGHQDTFAQALGIEHQKTPLNLEAHKRIGLGEGTEEDWEYLVTHNKEDVLGMREIMRALG